MRAVRSANPRFASPFSRMFVPSQDAVYTHLHRGETDAIFITPSALFAARVCGLSFTGWRVSASETNGSWLIRLKNAPAAVWAAVFQANPETVSKSGVATDGNRARPVAQRFTALAPALAPALRGREALDDLKQPGLSDSPLPAAFTPLSPAITGCATPSFGAATNFGVGFSLTSVAIGDLNGDGKLDLAVANFAVLTNIPGNVSVLLGTGTGSFGPPTNFAVGNIPESVAIGDLNGDGKPDLAVANTNSNNVSVLLNNCTVPTLTLADPAVCLGPGGLVGVTFSVTNSANTAQPVTATASLPAGLLTLAGTCTANVGTCTINNPATVSYSGTLAAGQTAIVSYQTQVADSAAPNTQLCVNTTASIAGAAPVSVQACTTVRCPPAGPGANYPSASALSSQKAGSVLIFNLYTSDAAAANRQNTRIALTNLDAARTAFVHLFFVDGTSCSIADSFVCLTPNQTAAFLASDIDPGTTGYLIAVATDRSGCPLNFNFLLGDAFVKLSSGPSSSHAANLPAESVAALPGGFVPCDPLASTAVLNFDDKMYNALPRTLALSNIASRADGNNTLLIVNRLGGSLATSASTLANLFGVLYDDGEAPFSFNFSPGTCQFRSIISSNFPRTTPRFEQVIPAGRSGWLKLALFTDGALSGAAINANTNAGTQANAFNQGHNLHKLTLTTTAALTLPVFPPSC